MSEKLTKIAGSLKYGIFSGESRKRILCAFGALSGVVIFLMILGIVMLSIEQAASPNPIWIFILALFAMTFGILVLPIICLIIIKKNERLRKEILLWIEDAIEVKAYSKKIDVFNPTVLFPAIKIQVNFEIDGQNYSRFSENKQLGGGIPEGYHYAWSQYADKKINILYSVKYDEVLILKDK